MSTDSIILFDNDYGLFTECNLKSEIYKDLDFKCKKGND